MVAVVNAAIGKDLAAVARNLRGDLFARWMAAAQRKALVMWQKRTVAPGLAARFELAGKLAYNWGERASPKRYSRYLFNNGLRKMMMGRKPHTERASLHSGMVVTRFAMGGGALNFLDSDKQRPVVAHQRGRMDVRFAAHGYRRKTRSGRVVVIRAYMSHHSVPFHRKIKGDVSYAQAWKRSFGAMDKAWLERATALEFRRIVRGMVFDRRTGRIKSSVLSDTELAEVA